MVELTQEEEAKLEQSLAGERSRQERRFQKPFFQRTLSKEQRQQRIDQAVENLRQGILSRVAGGRPLSQAIRRREIRQREAKARTQPRTPAGRLKTGQQKFDSFGRRFAQERGLRARIARTTEGQGVLFTSGEPREPKGFPEPERTTPQEIITSLATRRGEIVVERDGELTIIGNGRKKVDIATGGIVGAPDIGVQLRPELAAPKPKQITTATISPTGELFAESDTGTQRFANIQEFRQALKGTTELGGQDGKPSTDRGAFVFDSTTRSGDLLFTPLSRKERFLQSRKGIGRIAPGGPEAVKTGFFGDETAGGLFGGTISVLRGGALFSETVGLTPGSFSLRRIKTAPKVATRPDVLGFLGAGAISIAPVPIVLTAAVTFTGLSVRRAIQDPKPSTILESTAAGAFTFLPARAQARRAVSRLKGAEVEAVVGEQLITRSSEAGAKTFIEAGILVKTGKKTTKVTAAGKEFASITGEKTETFRGGFKFATDEGTQSVLTTQGRRRATDELTTLSLEKFKLFTIDKKGKVQFIGGGGATRTSLIADEAGLQTFRTFSASQVGRRKTFDISGDFARRRLTPEEFANKLAKEGKIDFRSNEFIPDQIIKRGDKEFLKTTRGFMQFVNPETGQLFPRGRGIIKISPIRLDKPPKGSIVRSAFIEPISRQNIIGEEITHLRQPRTLFELEDRFRVPYRFQASEITAKIGGKFRDRFGFLVKVKPFVEAAKTRFTLARTFARGKLFSASGGVIKETAKVGDVTFAKGILREGRGKGARQFLKEVGKPSVQATPPASTISTDPLVGRGQLKLLRQQVSTGARQASVSAAVRAGAKQTARSQFIQQVRAETAGPKPVAVTGTKRKQRQRAGQKAFQEATGSTTTAQVLKTTPELRTTPETRTGLGIKPGQLTGTVLIPRGKVDTLTDTSLRTGQEQLQSQRQITDTFLKSGLTTRTTGRTFPIVTPGLPPPPVRIPGIDFELEGPKKKKKKKRRLSFERVFNPSAKATALGIFGPTPRVLTGLGIRPIPLGRKPRSFF